ncbi:hypothetical protein Tco_0567597 [Tanacetum coccineum]
MDPSKVEAITKWPRPTTVTEGEKFEWRMSIKESFENLNGDVVSASDIDYSIRFTVVFTIYSDERRIGFGLCFDATWGSDRLRFKALTPLCKRLNYAKIKEAQRDDGELWAIVQNVEDGKHTEFRVDDGGVVWFEDRPCVPNDQALREKVMMEAHSSPFTILPGSYLVLLILK